MPTHKLSARASFGQLPELRYFSNQSQSGSKEGLNAPKGNGPINSGPFPETEFLSKKYGRSMRLS
jgi:hypothetical protein